MGAARLPDGAVAPRCAPTKNDDRAQCKCCVVFSAASRSRTPARLQAMRVQAVVLWCLDPFRARMVKHAFSAAA